MPGGVRLERKTPQIIYSGDMMNEDVTVFREITSSSPESVSNSNGEEDKSGHKIKSAKDDSDDYEFDIPVSRCVAAITRVLEKHFKGSSIVKVVVTHRKITEFLNTVINCTTATTDFVLSTLISCPHYIDIFLSCHLYMKKIFDPFKLESEKHKSALHPVIIRNIMCLLNQVQEYVLNEEEISQKYGDDDLWDSSEPAYDFLSNFTKGQGVNLSGLTIGTWFVSNIHNTDAAEFFLKFLVAFHNKAEFTVAINRWLMEECIIIELIEAMADISSSHDNITTVLLGLLDLTRQSVSSKKKGHKAVAQLGNYLYCPTTLDYLLTSILSLLKHQPVTADERHSKANGIKCSFQILSSILQFDRKELKSSISLHADGMKKKKKDKRVVIKKENIRLLLSNIEFMNLLHENLIHGRPRTYLQLTTCGTVPFGILRHSILGLIHDIVLHADEICVVNLIKFQNIFDYLLKYSFWLHPLNSFIHLKVCSIIQTLLRSGIKKAVEMVIFRSHIIEASIEFLKKSKPDGQQKPYIMKILQTILDCSHSVNSSGVKNALIKWIKNNPHLRENWEVIVSVTLPDHQKRQNILLGAVPKPVKGLENNDSFPSSEDTDDDNFTSDSD